MRTVLASALVSAMVSAAVVLLIGQPSAAEAQRSVVEARAFHLVDAAGRTRAGFDLRGSQGGPRLVMQESLVIGVNGETGDPSVGLLGQNGGLLSVEVAAGVPSVRLMSQNGGSLSARVSGETGDPRMLLVSETGAGIAVGIGAGVALVNATDPNYGSVSLGVGKQGGYVAGVHVLDDGGRESWRLP